MRIKNIPSIDRPREKLITYGPEKLTNVELMAIVLCFGTRKKGVLDMAKDILHSFHERDLSDVTIKGLTSCGVATTKACQIIACMELGKRILKGKKTRIVLKPKDVWNELRDIRGSKKEQFFTLYLDIRNQIITRELISVGSLTVTIVHPREVFEPAVRNNAAQIIIAHNHPSGDVHPSCEDITITKQLVNAGEILGIEITDHVIVSSSGFFSLKQNKLM